MRLSRGAEGGRADSSLCFRLLLCLGALLCLCSGAVAQEPRDLYLEVYINDISSGLIGRFTETAKGRLSADAGELCRIGLKAARGHCRDEVEVWLDQVPELAWRLDEETQTLHVQVGEAGRAARLVSAGDNPEDEGRPEESRPKAGFGLVLNYNLGLDWTQAGLSQGADPWASGQFEARAYSPIGVFNHGFSLSESPNGGLERRRLDSYWRSSWAGTAVQLQLGDVITRGPGWSRPVRLGGALIQRNFDLRPDLVTLALPSYAGTAAVPSTVDVFAESLRRYTTQVPAGPFVLTDLPLTTGTGDARIILRDATGRETEVTLPFLVSPDLLRPGLVDFAVAYGRPRLGFGTDSDRYDGAFYGAASAKMGLSERLTMSLHAEYGAGIRLAGLGSTFGVGRLGTLSLGLAHSDSDLGQGSLAELSGRLSLGDMTLSGRRLQTRGDFYDIARYSAELAGTKTAAAELASLSQLSLAIPLQARGAGLSLFYADSRRVDGSSETSLGASYSQQFRGGHTLNLTGVALEGAAGSDVALGLSLHVPLGKHRATGGRIETRDGRPRQSAFLSKRTDGHDPGWEWRLQLANREETELQARAAREHRFGRIDLAARLLGDQASFGLRADGSAVLGGGGFFLSRRIYDAFAVVDAGAPGVEVMSENRLVGTTGPGGKLLVPDLRAWEGNQLSIDVSGLPLDATVAASKLIVRPKERSGIRVDFGVDTETATALVGLVLPDGRPVPVGLSAELEATGENVLVGYDGQIYLSGLRSENAVTVRFLDNTTCRAVFPYQREPGSITQITEVLCE